MGSGGGTPRAKTEGPTSGTVYVLESVAGENGGKEKQVLRAVTVKAGATDGAYTEILEGLKEGDTIVTGTMSAAMAAAEPMRNPFSPFGGGPRPSPRR